MMDESCMIQNEPNYNTLQETMRKAFIPETKLPGALVYPITPGMAAAGIIVSASKNPDPIIRKEAQRYLADMRFGDVWRGMMVLKQIFGGEMVLNGLIQGNCE